MAKYNNTERRFSARIGAVLPGNSSGNYAEQRITVQPTGAVQAPGTIAEITALAEGSAGAPFITGCSVELWLARMSDGVNPITDADYTLAGTNFTPLTAAGAARWAIPGWHLAQVRVKAGVNAVGGTQYVSVSST